MIKSFLESSSIHGLGYIALTEKGVRLFWILVVFTGFTGAGILIYESFIHWAENPVTTTIETRPITEINYPKVTVCPPKNTFTDLNYDLKMMLNMTLGSKIRSELTNYSIELLYDHLFDTFMLEYDKIVEKDKYCNWYHGHSEILLPSSRNFGSVYDYAAPSGTISSQHFGEKYDAKNVQTDFSYNIHIYPLDCMKDNPNASLHYNVEKVSMKALSNGNTDLMYSYSMVDGDYIFSSNPINEDQTHLSFNFTPIEEDYYELRLERQVSLGDVKKQHLNLMPGYRFSWYYSGMEVMPDAKYSDNSHSKKFVRDK